MKASMSKTGSIRVLILFSIIILSGAVLLTSAQDITPPNRFSGSVTLNGAPAPVGTVIEAFIDGESGGSTVVELAGTYERLPVNGGSPDEDKTVTFKVNGFLAKESATWHRMYPKVMMCDLTAGDVSAGDTTHPDVTIISPSQGQQEVATATITVSGTASDDIGLDNVKVKVGSGDWEDVSTLASWSKSVTLYPGLNTIYAKAVDTSENSNTDQVEVNYNPPGTTGTPGSESSESNGGFAAAPGTTPTGVGTPAVAGETVTPATSTTPATHETPAATSAEEPGAEPEKQKGLPGFEAMFAIAGLLTVTYLIRRER